MPGPLTDDTIQAGPSGRCGLTPNDEALSRFRRGDAVLERLAPAREVLPALGLGKVLTHSGPPIAFGNMCAPMRGALAGAVVFEGWADSLAQATEMLARDEVGLVANHDAGGVAPMAGVISPSMLTYVLRNPAFGNTAVSNLNEGNVPDSLRCGANGPKVMERLSWVNGVVGQGIGRSLPDSLSIRTLIEQAVLMGDEQHQRNVAASLLLLRALLPKLLDLDEARQVSEYLTGSPQSFLNLAMAASKVLLDPLAGIPGCSLVTAMSRNGVDFGIRVSATSERWFTAPAPVPAGVYWDGFTATDANPDIGDSAIVETAGLGGFALAGAPALHPLVGVGRIADAVRLQQDMRRICFAESPFFLTSAVEGIGTPFGIDVLEVARQRVTPIITTGIAHREAGVGQVGVGLARAPLSCFVTASDSLTAVPGATV